MVAFKSAGTTFTTTGASTFTANVPTGGGAPVTGDLLVAVGIDWAGTGTAWTTPASPLWTLQKNANDAGTGDIGIHVYTRVAGASEVDQNFTLSVAEEGCMVMLCYSSPNATPVDITGATMTDPATTNSTLTTPVVTTTIANDVLLLIYGLGSDIAGSQPTLSTPATTTNRVATFGTFDAVGSRWTVLSIDEIAQAASGNSAQYSSSSTGNANSTYGAGAVVIALAGTAAATGYLPPIDPIYVHRRY